MQGCTPRLGVFFLMLFGIASALDGGETPPSWIDDAQLHDVRTVGPKLAFSVGEHGAIWKSEDGGKKWNRLNCDLDVSLKSVCFLDDQVGWVAGNDVMPYSALNVGILLATRDGGKSWKRMGKDVLTSLNYVRFFDLEEGIVVGQPSPLSPTGIFKTNDGGQTWRGVQGTIQQPWKAMCFVHSEMGVVAGANGRVSLMGGDRLFESNLPARGLRSVRAIGLTSNEVGWLAGDGGLVLKTSNGGVVWEAPATALPDELREGMDFRAVEIRDDKVWLAGSPGSVVWHSPDGGKSWQKQLTGQSMPLSALRFCNDQQGLGVGALGAIVRTEDGGKSWRPARGDGRRAALLSIHARPGMTSAPLLTKISGESGYRSAVWVAQRNDLGPLAVAADGESRLQSAVQKCGGNAADVHWQLPMMLPGIEYSPNKLTEEWQKQTEGRLPQTLLGGIVRQIRTWRPNVLVIDQPSPDDAACQLLYDAALRAVSQAADSTRFAEHSQHLGLSTWKVDRIYMRLAPGASGDALIDLDEFLPYLKSSTRIASGTSVALLQLGRGPQKESTESQTIAYRWLGTNGQRGDEPSAVGRSGGTPASRSRDFFVGLSIAPGSPARRDTGLLDEANLERMQNLVKKQRNFTAISQKSLDDPRMSGQMLGQIRGVVEAMEPRQAVNLLRDLADEYRKRSQFEMVEATYGEMVRMHPKEPGSLDAMRWLIQFWCSEETAWQRSRLMTSGTTIQQTRAEQQVQNVQQTVGETILADDGSRQAVITTEETRTMANSTVSTPTRLNVKLDLEAKRSPNKKTTKFGRLRIDQDVDWRTGAVTEWHSRAIELSKQLEVLSPNLFRSAEIQFPLASLRRGKGAPRAADSIMRTFASSAIDAETKQVAERELWASFETVETPQAYAVCRRASVRPNLDGLLSEDCWEAADEILLSADSSSSAASGSGADLPKSLTMFSYDDEFLYVAASVTRANGPPLDKPKLRGRQHDADLSRHDRITIRLDIDRDYATWYEFQIDQRGWTTESCWEDRNWNPKWFVAAEGEQDDWRIEIAIPWNELLPNPPQSGSIYGLSVLRTIPTVGLQSWAQPATAQPRNSSFGLLKFE